MVIPTPNRNSVLNSCHDDPLAAHLGVAKTLSKISELYYWPKMKLSVSRYIRNCQICGEQKCSQEARPGLMGQFKRVSYPFQLISLDLLGPFPRSKKGNQHLLVVTDWFSKFVLVHPMSRATASAIIKFLENQVFLIFGVPQIVLCDNGVQFTSNEFRKLMSDYKVPKIWFNAKYHPQVNPTERVNRVLVTAISSYINGCHTNWDVNIHKIAQAIRSSKHEVTNYSPNFLTFGRYIPIDGSFYGSCLNDVDTIQFDKQTRVDEDLQELPKLFQEVRTLLRKSYERSSRQYNLRKRDYSYSVGEWVWKRNKVLSDATKNFSSKLAPKFILCKIIKVISPLVYELQDETGKNYGRWHIKDLKPFRAETLPDEM